MSNFRTALSSVAVMSFLSQRGNPGAWTNRRPHDCVDTGMLSPLAVVPEVIDDIDMAGVQGVSGGGDMGVIGVLGHTLGEAGALNF